MGVSTSKHRANGRGERRRHSRSNRLVKVRYALADESIPPVDAWVADCSLGGICLQIHNEYAPGTQLLVRPASAPANLPWIGVEVTNCRRGEGATIWELGCQFQHTPSYSTILLFR